MTDKLPRLGCSPVRYPPILIEDNRFWFTTVESCWSGLEWRLGHQHSGRPPGRASPWYVYGTYSFQSVTWVGVWSGRRDGAEVCLVLCHFVVSLFLLCLDLKSFVCVPCLPIHLPAYSPKVHLSRCTTVYTIDSL